jgi:alpha-tubulin suppressor-like RCC1 family protein
MNRRKIFSMLSVTAGVFTLSATALALIAAPPAYAAYPITTHIGAGGYQGCAVLKSGHVACWGDNTHGQMGQGTNNNYQPTPTVVPGLSNVVAVAEGDYNTCAIIQGGDLKCWGYGQYGANGNNSTNEADSPVQVKGLRKGVRQVSIGEYHACAIVGKGDAVCWGYNANGELGNGTTTQSNVPVQVNGMTGGVTSISAGYYLTCAVQNAHAKCWGYNYYGEVGNGTTHDRHLPAQVGNLTKNVTGITAGYYDACANVSGSAKCWGYNYYGEDGNGTTIEHDSPVQVDGMRSGVTSIDANYYFACAVQNGAAKCWGYNYYNELGDGNANDHHKPSQVSGLRSNVVRVNTSWYSGFALMRSGVLKGWGYNDVYGCVGTGDTSTYQYATPVTVHT